jgi:hypothetical protein
MPSMTATVAITDPAGLAARDAAAPPRLSAPLLQERPPTTSSPVTTGITTGNMELDRLLERLHTSFGQLANLDGDDASDGDSTATELSSVYTAITGRHTGLDHVGAGQLASRLGQDLGALTTPLTDRIGQSMLRSL